MLSARLYIVEENTLPHADGMYRNEEIYMCIVSVWNTMSEVTVDLLEKPSALPLYSCKQSFFFIFFLANFNQLADYGGNGLTSWVKLWETL